MCGRTTDYQGADTEKLKGGGTGYCNQGSVRKHTKARGVWGHAPPRKILESTTSEMVSGGFYKTTNADKNYYINIRT